MVKAEMINKLFSESLEYKFTNYKTLYLLRITVVSFIALIIYLLQDNLITSIILSLAIELYVVDLFTDRIMPPAFMCKSTYMHKLDRSHETIKVLFLFLNGGTVLFIMTLVLFL